MAIFSTWLHWLARWTYWRLFVAQRDSRNLHYQGRVFLSNYRGGGGLGNLHALLDDVCPSLKTLTILITSDEGHEVTSWVNWFTKFRTLRSKRGTDVAVLV